MGTGSGPWSCRESPPHPSLGLCPPALHGPSQQPRCSSLSLPFPCPQPSVPPSENTRDLWGAPALCPQQAPHPHLTAAVPMEPPPTATACPKQDIPFPLRGTRQGVGFQEETRSPPHSSTLSLQGAGRAAWEGGDLGPPGPALPPGALGPGPTKSSRKGAGGRQVRRAPPHLALALCGPAEPHHSQLVPTYLAGPPASHPHSWPLSSHLCPI